MKNHLHYFLPPLCTFLNNMFQFPMLTTGITLPSWNMIEVCVDLRLLLQLVKQRIAKQL